MNGWMFSHISGVFNVAIGKTPIELGAYSIKKVLCCKVDTFKKILPFCGPLSKEISTSVISCRIGKIQFIFSGPERLASIDGCL